MPNRASCTFALATCATGPTSVCLPYDRLLFSQDTDPRRRGSLDLNADFQRHFVDRRRSTRDLTGDLQRRRSTLMSQRRRSTRDITADWQRRLRSSTHDITAGIQNHVADALRRRSTRDLTGDLQRRRSTLMSQRRRMTHDITADFQGPFRRSTHDLTAGLRRKSRCDTNAGLSKLIPPHPLVPIFVFEGPSKASFVHSATSCETHPVPLPKPCSDALELPANTSVTRGLFSLKVFFGRGKSSHGDPSLHVFQK